MATKAIPDGYQTATPYLAVDDAAEAIEYYKKAFGAKERVRMDAPDGKIGHAELEIGDSLVMLSDPFPQATTRTPKELGGTSASVFMYRRGRRHGREGGSRRGRDEHDGGRRPVLGRPRAPSRIRSATRGRRDARRGCPAGGDGGAGQGGHGRDEQLRLGRARRWRALPITIIRPCDPNVRPRAQRRRAQCDAALSHRVCYRRDLRDGHWYCSRPLEPDNHCAVRGAGVRVRLRAHQHAALAGRPGACDCDPDRPCVGHAQIAVMEIVDNAIVVLVPGAMDAGLASLLFWGSLAFALAVAGVFAFPVNRWLIVRGKGHTAVHKTGIHGGPPTRLVAAATAVAFIFGTSVLVAEVIG